MRRETPQQNFETTAKAAVRPERERAVSWLGLFGIVLILLLASRISVADPASTDPSVAVTAALVAVHVEIPLASQPRATLQQGEALNTPVSAPIPSAFGELLVVPHDRLYLTDAELADESIAEAVAEGTNPDLIIPSKFRKRSMDLFRTERQVEFARREMLVKLRLRAKTKKAVSVEVRF